LVSRWPNDEFDILKHLISISTDFWHELRLELRRKRCRRFNALTN
jgi:hypothetical protein